EGDDVALAAVREVAGALVEMAAAAGARLGDPQLTLLPVAAVGGLFADALFRSTVARALREQLPHPELRPGAGGALPARRLLAPTSADPRRQKREPMTAIDTYRSAVLELIQRTQEESEQLERASGLIARSLQDGGVLHVFGSGHSMLPAIDATFRAGGLAPVNLVHDPALAPWEPTRVSRIERLERYGTAIAELQDFRRGEVLVVISHSGINPVPTQLAQQAQQDGLTVVAITSCEHSRSGRSRHPDGLRLLDVADIV